MAQDLREAHSALTKEQIQAVINQKLDNTIYWLNKAYDARPQDPAAEKTLLELMAELQKMKREANEILGLKPRRELKEHQRPSHGGLKDITP
ncbi:MAG TPA: hypothetical protein VMN77_06745 [Nitrospiria bacterium]|jgi:hypothetical protein|nr:hypothetical protein [Nitrospiria bacterium]